MIVTTDFAAIFAFELHCPQAHPKQRSCKIVTTPGPRPPQGANNVSLNHLTSQLPALRLACRRSHADHTAALEEALRQVSGGQTVKINVNVDPSIIGGIVVQLGSRQVDASLKTKLNSLRTRMKEVG